jgi:hypothetical protein
VTKDSGTIAGDRLAELDALVSGRSLHCVKLLARQLGQALVQGAVPCDDFPSCQRFGRPIIGGPHRLRSGRSSIWAEASHGTVSHQVLVWDLVISSRTSRHREEQNGEVLAFMIRDTCFAWWSKQQLGRLAERKQQEREAQEAEWSRMKGGPVNNA